MPRLGRRGIVLSLFLNGLNIVLYLIILVAACLNIAEASVNFIILNAFAASFACLLIVSEIRLPQLTYEYFRFLCTYRGRGLTYLFFGCLVASQIAFNLYGGIIVVCMGLAFFMLSYVKLIPPLDGLILNYKKLDLWKEQRHFRVQLEAQRIFEQQLQQEQNLARMIPAHHPNSMTVHAHMASCSSPKQIRAFSAINAGSTNFPGATGVGTSIATTSMAPTGALTCMFSPPISPLSRKPPGQPILPQAQNPRADQELQFPHHQLQTKLQGSTANFGLDQKGQTSQECLSSSTTHGPPLEAAIGRGKGRAIQNRVANDDPSTSSSSSDIQRGQGPKQPLQLNKSLPPIGKSELEYDLGISAAFMLSPPPTRRASAIDSEPASPLQYLMIDEFSETSRNNTPGGKTEWHGGLPDRMKEHVGSLEDGILKSAPHPSEQNSQHQQQQQFPLRTTNKPVPPHDPFRKSSISSTHTTNSLLSNLFPSTAPNAFNPNPGANAGWAHRQSLYQPSEPPSLGEQVHPLQQHPQPHTMPITATSQILSSIGGISGCYGITGGVRGAAALAASASGVAAAAILSQQQQQQSLRQDFSYPNQGGPLHSSASSNSNQCKKLATHPHQQPHATDDGRTAFSHNNASNNNSIDPLQQLMPMPAAGSSGRHQLQPPRGPKQQRSDGGPKRYMPDIVLTLPTPAESGNGSRKEGYFAM